MKLSIVVAFDRNRVIGRGGTLPWHLPDDLRRFRTITMGKPILMGRRTHESIGRALPGRRNIVLSGRPGYTAQDCDVFASLNEALAALDVPEVMVIGGAAVYEDAFPQCERLYLTEIDAAFEGDVQFPWFDPDAWHERSNEQHPADERHAHAFRFRILERVSAAARPPRTAPRTG